MVDYHTVHTLESSTAVSCRHGGSNHVNSLAVGTTYCEAAPQYGGWAWDVNLLPCAAAGSALGEADFSCTEVRSGVFCTISGNRKVGEACTGILDTGSRSCAPYTAGGCVVACTAVRVA